MNPYEFLIVLAVGLALFLGWLVVQYFSKRNGTVKKELSVARKEIRVMQAALTKVSVAETVEVARLTASIAIDETSRLQELES